jgi:hypothetical protein
LPLNTAPLLALANTPVWLTTFWEEDANLVPVTKPVEVAREPVSDTEREGRRSRRLLLPVSEAVAPGSCSRLVSEPVVVPALGSCFSKSDEEEAAADSLDPDSDPAETEIGDEVAVAKVLGKPTSDAEPVAWPAEPGRDSSRALLFAPAITEAEAEVLENPRDARDADGVAATGTDSTDEDETSAAAPAPIVWKPPIDAVADADANADVIVACRDGNEAPDGVYIAVILAGSEVTEAPIPTLALAPIVSRLAMRDAVLVAAIVLSSSTAELSSATELRPATAEGVSS